MKNKLLSIAMIFSLALVVFACGGGDEQTTTTTQESNPVLNGTWYNTGNTQVSSAFVSFRDRVNSSSFAARQATSVVNTYIVYEKNGIFNVGTQENFIVTYSPEVYNHPEFASKTAALNAMKAAVNSPYQIQMFNQNAFYVMDTTGNIYGINLALPLEANPVYKANAQNKMYYNYYRTRIVY